MFQNSVNKKSKNNQRCQHWRQILLSMTKIMLKAITLISHQLILNASLIWVLILVSVRLSERSSKRYRICSTHCVWSNSTIGELFLALKGIAMRFYAGEFPNFRLVILAYFFKMRITNISCDFWHYKERHAIKCLLGKLKYYRWISTRYEKKP